MLMSDEEGEEEIENEFGDEDFKDEAIQSQHKEPEEVKEDAPKRERRVTARMMPNSRPEDIEEPNAETVRGTAEANEKEDHIGKNSKTSESTEPQKVEPRVIEEGDLKKEAEEVVIVGDSAEMKPEKGKNSDDCQIISEVDCTKADHPNPEVIVVEDEAKPKGEETIQAQEDREKVK